VVSLSFFWAIVRSSDHCSSRDLDMDYQRAYPLTNPVGTGLMTCPTFEGHSTCWRLRFCPAQIAGRRSCIANVLEDNNIIVRIVNAGVVSVRQMQDVRLKSF